MSGETLGPNTFQRVVNSRVADFYAYWSNCSEAMLEGYPRKMTDQQWMDEFYEFYHHKAELYLQ